MTLLAVWSKTSQLGKTLCVVFLHHVDFIKEFGSVMLSSNGIQGKSALDSKTACYSNCIGCFGIPNHPVEQPIKGCVPDVYNSQSALLHARNHLDSDTRRRLLVGAYASKSLLLT